MNFGESKEISDESIFEKLMNCQKLYKIIQSLTKTFGRLIKSPMQSS